MFEAIFEAILQPIITLLVSLFIGCLEISFDIGFWVLARFDKKRDKELSKANTIVKYSLALLGIFVLSILIFIATLVVIKLAL